jgi:hypothetical protein
VNRKGGTLGSGLFDIKFVAGGRHEVRKSGGSHDFGDVLVNVYGTSGASYSGISKATFYGDKLVAAVPENLYTASTTLAAGDSDSVVAMNVASANNVTVPPDTTVNFPIGTTIEVYQHGAGQTTIVAGAGVTLRSDGGKLKIAAQYNSASLRKRAANEWVVGGSVTT